MRALRVVVLLVVVGAVVTWSALHGAPGKLPGAALGWRPLFYVERAAALLGGVGIVLLVGWRALHGHFPIRFGNIEYEKELDASTQTVDSHEQRLRIIEDWLDLVDDHEGA
jgi:hypothetical protein